MGTRALIHIKDEGKTLVTIYRQYDGYPTGLGRDIALRLPGSKIVNGISGDNQAPKQFNGMGCLAAWLIANLKCGIGGVYIYPADSEDVDEEFIYELSEEKGNVILKIIPAFEQDKAAYFDLSDKAVINNIILFEKLLIESEGK